MTPRPTLKNKFIAERIYKVKPSGIRRFFGIAAKMPDVISLGIGEPDFTTPQPIFQAGFDSVMRGVTNYTANSGLLELRERLAEHLEQLYGVAYRAEGEMMITVGVSEALRCVFGAICNPGDEIIVPTPCFVAYEPEILFADGVPVTVTCRAENNFEITAQEIEPLITERTKAIFLGYPNNPTGAVLEREELEAIARVADRHDLLVYTDEIYDRLVYGDHQHTAFSSLPGMRERTILLGGFSKSYAMTGWRIGYVAAPSGLMTGIAKVHQYGIMCAPTSAQFAAIEALKNGEPHLQAMRAEYDRRRRYITDRFNAIGMSCFEPMGAFYCFPHVTECTGLDETTFAEKLLEEERVGVVPGTAFGPSGAGHVRVCYATAYEQIVEAMDRIERFALRHRA